MGIDLQDEIRAQVREFYADLETNEDFEQTACCPIDTQKHVEARRFIPEAAMKKNYGCGSPVPDDFETLKGLTAVDLGSGAGIDSMLLRYYLGPEGRMIGIDMTDKQLERARHFGKEFMSRVGYDPSTLEFRKDYIEMTESIEDSSVDVVISNCVINLSPQKEMVFENIHRILKPGGELIFSDIVSDCINPHLKEDKRLVAECIGLAPYIGDLRDMMEAAGFPNVRVVGTPTKLEKSGRLADEPAEFYSMILRQFKLDLDRRCEEYGQVAKYNGGLISSPKEFVLDNEHTFEAGRWMSVCKNTADMLSKTRLQRYFNVTEPGRHYGEYKDCGTPKPTGEDDGTGACC